MVIFVACKAKYDDSQYQINTHFIITNKQINKAFLRGAVTCVASNIYGPVVDPKLGLVSVWSFTYHSCVCMVTLGSPVSSYWFLAILNYQRCEGMCEYMFW